MLVHADEAGQMTVLPDEVDDARARRDGDLAGGDGGDAAVAA